MPAVPPLSPYGTFAGSLFQYSRNLVAFESAPPTGSPPTRKCILIGGLSDGLVPTPYTKKLEEACHVQGWSLVQPILSSSYLGFGNGSISRDTNEIRYVGEIRFRCQKKQCFILSLMRPFTIWIWWVDHHYSELLWYLSCHRSAEYFALVGHSTGCQNSIHFLKVRTVGLWYVHYSLHWSYSVYFVLILLLLSLLSCVPKHGQTEMIEKTRVSSKNETKASCMSCAVECIGW